MSTQIVTCPACHKSLRSGKPVPVGASLRCPECKHGFAAPPARGSLAGPGLIAVAASVILGGSAITAALLLSGSRTPQPEARKEDDSEAKRKLEEATKKLADTRKELEAEKAKLELGRLLDTAEAALKAGQHAEAEKLFVEAYKLSPSDARAVSGLVEARTALATAAKINEVDGKREAEREKLLADGKDAIAEKKYARAVPLLEAARAVAPMDKTVLDALAEAKAGLEADEAQKKTLADYNKALASAKLALDGNRFGDAARDFAAALGVMPDSAEAKDGLKQAEGKLAGVANLEKRQKAMEQLLDQARAAQGRTAYKEAADALRMALRLMPEDREAARLLRIAEDSLKKAKAGNASLLSKARAALANQQFDEAVRLAGDAVRAWPEDEAAKKMLRDVERLRDTVQTTNLAYARAVQSGALAMANNLYGDAVIAYTEALRLNPLNDTIARELRNARLALERDVRSKTEYERLVRVGTLALNAGRWAEAGKVFAKAASLLPGDRAAPEGLSRARYGQAMAAGNLALNQKRKADALAAFDAALAELPGDAAARLGKQRARMLK